MGDIDAKSTIHPHNSGEILGCKAPDIHKTKQQNKKRSLKI